MKYKALITDLDGTAVLKGSDGSDIPGSLLEAVDEAKKSGVKIACATGRSWHLARPVVERLGLVDPCIVEGGTRIVDPIDGKTLWSQTIDIKSTAQIFEIFERHDEGGVLAYSDDVEPMVFSAIDQGSITDANFLYLLALPEDIANSLASELNALNQDFVAHITPSWRGEGYDDVHVTHRLGDKEHAIKQWQSMTGVTMAETVGIGDSGNDIPIFNAVGLKIAVGNASVELQDVSDYIAPNQEDGALGHIIEKYFS